MKQDETKKLIREEWLSKIPMEERTTLNILKFYMYLEKERPDLLKFKYGGDKYQKVKSFLMNLTLEYNRP